MVENAMRNAGPLVLANYLIVYVGWGTTYFFIKTAVESIPPFVVVGGRFAVGGLLLLAGNGLITVAERRIDSYVMALPASSAPIVEAVFDRLLLGRRLTAR